MRRVADPDFPSLFALEVTCTTIDASMAATDQYHLLAAVEGYDAADLLAGTASAKQITVSFDMKFSVAGVYGVSIRNSATNRSFVGTVAQNSANVRESKTVTLTLDTTGTWLYTNGVGLYLSFCLAAGANFQTTAGSWQAGDLLTTSAQVNFMSSITNIGYIGRIQLEKGAVATDFEGLSYQQDLDRCKRYFITFGGNTLQESIGASGVTYNTSSAILTIPFQQNMRTVPTLSVSALSDFIFTTGTIGSGPITAMGLINAGVSVAELDVTGTGAPFSINQPVIIRANSALAARLRLNARLS
jgi:hypothetical protein